MSPRVRLLFTTVADGDLTAPGQRSRLRDSLGVPVVWMDQIHGDHVVVVGSDSASIIAATDALVTATPGVALAVRVADCVPVLLLDAEAGVVAVAHAGREGVRRHVVDRTLEAMADLGADAARVQVRLGPAVCGRCYEVPAELRDLVEAAVPGTSATTRQGTPSLDLRAGLAAGLTGRVASVEVDAACTMEDETYYSFRRTPDTGRFAGVVWLEP